MNPGDLFSFLGNSGLMNRFQDMQRSLRQRTFVVSSSNSLVKVTFNFQQEIIDVHIDPSLIDPARAGTLKASLVEAFNQGINEARGRMIEETQRLFSGS